jgi:PQQ-like domain
MRTGISTLGILTALLLVGACFDPTRPCSTNADCENGGTCDPGTKTCVAAGNPDDKIAPVFSIVVTPPPSRQDTPKLTEYDPGSPDAGRGTFRRDENVVVTITSRDPDVDASSVKLMVHGVATNSGTAVEVQLGPCAASNPAASNAFCREGTVQLAPLPFEAFRAVVPLEVSGSDLSDNVGRADAGLDVTRWKWRYLAGAPIYTTPAIADDGTIVFGTSDGGSGSVYALAIDGTEKWNAVGIGPIKASPVIGNLDAGQQLAYVGTAATSGKIVALDLVDGSVVTTCPSGASGYGGPILGSPAFVVGATSFEGALALVNGERLINIRPGPSIPDDRCVSASATSSQAFPSSVVSASTAAYLGTNDGTVRAFNLLSGNWVPNINWGGGIGYSPVGNAQVQLALVVPNVIGTTSLRGIFTLDQGTGGLQANYPDGGIQSDPGGLVFSQGEYLFGGGSTASPVLYVASQTLSSGLTRPLSDALVGTPVAGKDGLVYLATVGGTLESRAGPSTTRWAATFGPGESFLGSPTIGCGPPATALGALYVGSVSGSLFAVVVDSAGLESTSPWPKYQHDVRNTGNPTTPIQSCP